MGKGQALVLDLGITGEVGGYWLPNGTLVLVEPTRAWWDADENFGDKGPEVAALFAEVLASPAKGAMEVGRVQVPSGKLALYDANADLRPVAKVLKDKLGNGEVRRFGRDGDGLVIALRKGAHRVRRRAIRPGWAKKHELVVVTIAPGAPGRKPAAKAAPKKASTKKPAAKRPNAPRVPSKALPKTSRLYLWTPSPELAAVIGPAPERRQDIAKKFWTYVTAHKLDKAGWIRADAKLKKVFKADKLFFTDVTKAVSANLK